MMTRSSWTPSALTRSPISGTLRMVESPKRVVDFLKLPLEFRDGHVPFARTNLRAGRILEEFTRLRLKGRALQTRPSRHRLLELPRVHRERLSPPQRSVVEDGERVDEVHRLDARLARV